jgi:hypothetical protein
MSQKRLIIILISFIALFALGYFYLQPAYSRLSSYLSMTEQVNANILIVEGWLPESAIETAQIEFLKNKYKYIITTGLKSISDYYQISMNGYLIFYAGNRLSSLAESGPHTIEISAYSELGGQNCAHFNVFVNDSLVSEFTANKRKHNYPVSWTGKLTKIDSIMVQFDNDKVGEFGDRNLYIKEIIIDHKIRLPYLNNSSYDVMIQGGKRRIRNNYNSFAELARNELLSIGVDSSLVLAVPANLVKINRTLTSALAVRDWLKRSDIMVEGINIVSEGTHARRTWMTYNKVLAGSYKIGIISLPEYKDFPTRKNRFFNTLRQTIAIVYYWFILIPY